MRDMSLRHMSRVSRSSTVTDRDGCHAMSRMSRTPFTEVECCKKGSEILLCVQSHRHDKGRASGVCRPSDRTMSPFATPPDRADTQASPHAPEPVLS